MRKPDAVAPPPGRELVERFPLLQITVLTVAIFVASLMLASCTRFEDGYDFGDVTLTAIDLHKRVSRYQQIYCSVVPEEQRQEAIAALQGMDIEYGDDGFCGLTVTAIISRVREEPPAE